MNNQIETVIEQIKTAVEDIKQRVANRPASIQANPETLRYSFSFSTQELRAWSSLSEEQKNTRLSLMTQERPGELLSVGLSRLSYVFEMGPNDQ